MSLRPACLLLSSFTEGDACSNDVVGMYEALTARGVECHIFAEHWSETISLPISRIEHYPCFVARHKALTIYHHSIGWLAGFEFFAEAPGPKIMRYHNVTPAAFFQPYSPHSVELSLWGAAQTKMLVEEESVDLFLGDSPYNVQGLVELGASPQKCRVLYPFHRIEDLGKTDADISTLQRFLDGTFNLLFVGRVAPNKGHRYLFQVLDCCRRNLGDQMRLILVGPRVLHLESYDQELAHLLHHYQIENRVVLTGHVSLAELKAYYLLAHVFLVMSEHEGFCVPVVESMYHRVPVVAYAYTAVPETLGDHPLLIEGLRPDDYTVAIERLLYDRLFLRRVLHQQTERYQSTFTPERLRQELLQAVWPFLA